MPRRRTLLPRFAAAVAAIVVLVGVGSALGVIAYAEDHPCPTCEPDARIADGRAAAALRDARARWRGQHLADYSFRVRVRCFCGPIDHRVVVRGGRAVKPPADVRGVSTVPLLFRKVAHAIQEGVHVLRVRYDTRTGLPREIRIEPADEDVGDGSVMMVSDDEVTYRAARLRPLPHR